MTLAIVALVRNTNNVMVEDNSIYFIGLMSGTSLDGVDAVLVDKNIKLIEKHYLRYPNELKNKLHNINNKKIFLTEFADLDLDLANIYAKACIELINKSNISNEKIMAIGAHGQTIFHKPKKYSLQIANPAIIAEKTNINVIADFRMADIAAGGEGAPLAPYFHKYILAESSAIFVNLGGIANITLIENSKTIGFDTGPANILLDNYCKKYFDKDFDKDGEIAKTGRLNYKLLEKMLTDKYFFQKPPKSTGAEYFNLKWLNKYLPSNIDKNDVMATLTELSAITITKELNPKLDIYLYGGGVHNKFLITRIKKLAENCNIKNVSAIGIDPDFLEAQAFAYFARETINKRCSNEPTVTGAKSKKILGSIYYA